MSEQTCDFCGAAVNWTEHQIRLDLQLRARGLGGLGVTCNACDDRIVELAIAEEEAHRRREAEEEEMERHFREHPHG